MKLTALCIACLIIAAAPGLDPLPEHASGFDVTVKALIAAQTTAIVAMWVYMKRELHARDKQREKLWAQVARLTGFARLIKACKMERCPFSEVQLVDEDEV